MTRRLVSPTMIGRSQELGTLTAALDAVQAGHPRHVLVGGEAGVGKSRLARELAALARDRGIRVLTGGCTNVGGVSLPFGPIVDILRGLVVELAPAELVAVLGPARADLARLLPALDPRPIREAEGLTEASLQARLLDGLLGVLGRLSERQPVLVVVEDLHWGDPASRDAVALLAHGLRDQRVMLLVTFRSDELHRRHPLLPWLAEVARGETVERVDLHRLGPDDVATLVATILGSDPPPGLVDDITARSEGNPFFVEELLGSAASGDGRRLPPTLRDVLLARLAALPEAAQAVLGVISVAGCSVSHRVLEAAALMPPDRLLEGLREAVASQVLETGGWPGGGPQADYAFRHALLQEVAYEDLLPGERMAIHRRVAQALSAEAASEGAIGAGHWAELAHHWSAAREDALALGAFVRAGAESARSFAFADAWRLDERALELWGRVDGAEALAGIDHVGLLDRASLAAWLSGDSRRSVALRREALERLGPAGDPLRRGVLLERLGRALWYDAQSQAALAAHEEAVAVMPADPPTAELARVLAGYGQILMLLDRIPESIEACQAAADMALQVGARHARGHALNTLGLDLAVVGRGAEGIAQLREALAMATEDASADDIGRAYVNLSDACLFAGDAASALAAAQEGVRVSEDVGIGGTYGRYIAENGVVAAFEAGDWAESARLAAISSALHDGTARQQARYALAAWAPLLVATGDDQAAEALRRLDASVDPGLPEAQFSVPLRTAQAEHALWRRDPEEALARSNQGIDELAGRGWHWKAPRLARLGLSGAADLAVRARDERNKDQQAEAVAAAEALWGRMEVLLAPEAARQQGRAGDRLAAERLLAAAELARAQGSAAAADWLAAAAAFDGIDAAYPAAGARWRAAEALATAGNRPHAAEQVTLARATALRLGARPLLAELDALAARARLDLSEAAGPAATAVHAPVTAADPFGLTRREREVLRHLVKGRTNRQIADALFISENTAGVHVSNILGKLGATTRTEAAAIAARQGLAGD